MNALAQRRRTAREDGFTLIELLIVIIILGILAAIVVFAVGSTRKDSVSSACKTDIKSVQLSAEAANTKNGTYPAAQTDLTDSTKGGLLKTYPESSDYTLTYAQTGSGSGYTISTSGPNVTAKTLTDKATKAEIDAACTK